jgi:hypothetical protein
VGNLFYPVPFTQPRKSKPVQIKEKAELHEDKGADLLRRKKKEKSFTGNMHFQSSLLNTRKYLKRKVDSFKSKQTFSEERRYTEEEFALTCKTGIEKHSKGKFLFSSP